jgi:hypothetical protein
MSEQPIHIDTINGDFCLNKYVYNADSRAADETEVEVVSTQPNETKKAEDVVGRNEEGFHFVHPEIDDDEAWRIHDAVKRLVARQGIQEICQYLKQMADEKKILLPQNAEKVYNELVRMGMPNGEGYTLKTFRNCYVR